MDPGMFVQTARWCLAAFVLSAALPFACGGDGGDAGTGGTGGTAGQGDAGGTGGIGGIGGIGGLAGDGIPGGQASVACETDDDCIVSGCSNHLCAAVPLVSTCEFRPEYACYRPGITSCGCVNRACGWAQTPALAECLANPGCVPGEQRIDGCRRCVCETDGRFRCDEGACPRP